MKRWSRGWSRITAQDRPALASRRGVLIVALLVTAGLVGWWQLLPATVLAGGGEPAGLGQLAVTALLTLPLAVLAAAGAAWVARRRRWSAGSATGLLRRAAAGAGLLSVLLLASAPAASAAQERLVPTPLAPNLAAIQYEVSCPSGMSALECQRIEAELAGLDASTVASHHRAMIRHTGHSPAAQAAMTSEFYPSQPGPGPDAAAYAIQDAAIAFFVALAAGLLGGFAVAGLLPAAAPAINRRGLTRLRYRWIAVGSATAVALTGAVVFVSSAATAQPAPQQFTQQLRIPPVLQGSEVTLVMEETDVQILPDGPPTRMWTFNGSFPGPTIRRPSGEPTQLTVRNELPPSFGEATIHHHGSHSRPSEDGQPDTFLIPGGGLRTYTYEHLERGEPEWAATQWYHDHRMDLTGRNVWNGLVGLFILDDAVEQALNLPRGEFDVPLILADRTFDEHNQIPYVFNFNGTTGDTVLVNGVSQPFFDVGDRKYRVRVLNASNRRPFTLALSNGAPLTQIGTESGLLPAPVTRNQIQVAPAERVELVIDFAGQLGEEIVLENVVGGGGGGGVTTELMQFRVNRDLVDNSRLPASLRPVPDFPNPDVTREFTLDLTDNMWTINGLPFEADRFDARPVLGSTERWIFTNDTDQPHALHIHDVDWLLESRNGQPPPPWEAALKETWWMQPGETISLITTFTDHIGPYVFHCHMLEHEDLAMMAQFEVVPATG